MTHTQNSKCADQRPPSSQCLLLLYTFFAAVCLCLRKQMVTPFLQINLCAFIHTDNELQSGQQNAFLSLTPYLFGIILLGRMIYFF